MKHEKNSIIFIRHAQTDWNIDGRLNSLTDISINEEGIENITQVSKRLKDLGINKIISSPLLRAKQTSAIISEILNIPIEYDSRLVELNFGKFEGLSPDKIILTDFANEFKLWREEENPVIPEGVESFEKIAIRATSFINDYKKVKGKIIVVTHGVFLRALLMHCIFGLKPSYYQRLKINNGGISVVAVERENFLKLTKLNA